MTLKKEHWNEIKPILLIGLTAIVTYLVGSIEWSKEKNYSLRYNDMKQKEALYIEVIDIYQVILNELVPNLEDKIKARETLPITNKYANVMNRCILYFDKPIGDMIEKTMQAYYWENTNKAEMTKIMKAMADEIRSDRKALSL